MESQTPITDAAAFHRYDDKQDGSEVVLATVCRKLETDLAEAIASLRWNREALVKARKERDGFKADKAALVAALAGLEAAGVFDLDRPIKADAAVIVARATLARLVQS